MAIEILKLWNGAKIWFKNLLKVIRICQIINSSQWYVTHWNDLYQRIVIKLVVDHQELADNITGIVMVEKSFQDIERTILIWLKVRGTDNLSAIQFGLTFCKFLI